ncbi:unnamed protein product [Mycena citricolor]|uniref:GIT Spa2 homology (SHD) domain-containing protein n=1 Tax=Mycena citricolor TaxID=2018698 RepID=A0AAD2GX83_9AGAR|nr:unnamed protein product [Mycena citricolor]
MSRVGTRSRQPSPTGTSFSGISNYRTESFRRDRDKNVPPVPPIDYRAVSEVHFNELDRYLAAYLARAAPNSRTSARQKLTRLTIQQFHELSTDVYDELCRRKNETQIPFLPVREEFHPKRNQARQKLATLPVSRFEDLSSDVYFELGRRYPEFKENPSGGVTPGSNYDDQPVSDFPNNSSSRGNGRTSTDRPGDSGYGGSISSRRPSEDRRRPSEDYQTGRRSATSGDDSSNAYTPSASSRRKPSQDTTRRSEDRERERERDRDYRGGRGGSSISGMSDSSNMTAQQQQSTTSTIIPNTSTIEEEYIEVPYGREARESAASTTFNDDRDRRDADPEPPDTASDYPLSPQSPPGGLSGLGARLLKEDSGEEDYDNAKFGRSSVTSDRERDRGRGNNDEMDKLRRDYELQIATTTTQISIIQRERDQARQEASERDRQWQDSEVRLQQVEDELAGVRRQAEVQMAEMIALQRELDELQSARQREQEQAQKDEEEIRSLRERCEELEQGQSGGGGADPEVVEQLREDMQGLLAELGDLSSQNDELLSAKDADALMIRDLEAQAKDYKRKYEQAKTELRSFKATSQLFIQAPKMDRPEDQLPVSADGGVLDVHITAFLSSVDSLLTAGRSNAPTRVLAPMKAVVNAVSAIVDDIRAFEARPSRDVDDDTLASLRDRAEATLSNLVTATKTHATSSGMSPVSLLDAATSHVAATVTEIARMIAVRKSTRAEQELAMPATPVSTLRTIEENKPSQTHQRRPSAATSTTTSPTSTRNGPRVAQRSPVSPISPRRRPPSENSSSETTNSPPPIFDQPSNNDPVVADGAEDAWAELKPYLEAQSESIVYAIQSVLSGVRSPTPSPTLNENLTQIITIVSSIVAVCNDNLPPASAQQGNDILRELGDHANRLSEVQALPEVTKDSRQVMAKSSFAIANAMKGLMKL